MFVSPRTLQECFETENKGTQISSEYAKCLIGDPDATFPVLGPETTEDDLIIQNAGGYDSIKNPRIGGDDILEL